MTRHLFVFLGMVSLAACVTQQPKSGTEAVLFNPVITANAFEVSVLSNGCTSADDFYLKVSEGNVELRRNTVDVCRAAPRWLRLSFDYPFGDNAYRIKNKVRYKNRVGR